jgi:ubiquinone biosynthesis protein COQ9
VTTDADVKRAALGAILASAATEGFTPAMAAADGAGVFAGNLAAVMTFWSAEVDAELERRLQAMDMTALSIRKRIRAGVLTRLAILKPHKEAARKAVLLPQSVMASAESLWQSADILWRAAGDQATDFNFYTKRMSLAAVLSTTMIAWFGDDSEDEAPTAQFLDARIANVLQFEKLKARVQEACSPAPGKPS